ncbi:hypothetical protein IscW_ISCW012603 [Ixodes scapularis]|uniref:Uncharacterized protein n=1 Tax=Ixodes scapularis TaxID=6945 RepID=B7QE63_IXOSC|nr:hypothetical protein IscW_ISCW012603 [Ixodes scapularis]|eukprot:XP_002413827.1 hypothetical protein IscW_ISCW012603 [Ixodes scapularis]
MAEDENIPFSFQGDGWVENPPQCANLSQDEVWRYLRSKLDSVQHANRGWAFKEEGYVRNVRWTIIDDSRIFLVRGICLPSMRKLHYTVSAWFSATTGTIMGCVCGCVAG